MCSASHPFLPPLVTGALGFWKEPAWAHGSPILSPGFRAGWSSVQHRPLPRAEGLEGMRAASLQRAWVCGDPVHSYSACKSVSKWFEALPCRLQSKVIEISDSCLRPLGSSLPNVVTRLPRAVKRKRRLKPGLFHSTHVSGAQ